MFCGLPHEEEGQGVTGEVEEALPVPGGIDAGIRDEGLRCMSLAASRVVSMADLSPCVHGAGASQQEHCGVVPVGKQFGK